MPEPTDKLDCDEFVDTFGDPQASGRGRRHRTQLQLVPPIMADADDPRPARVLRPRKVDG